MARIDVVGDELTRIVAPLPGFFKGDVGIDPKGKHVFLPLERITQSPPLPAFGADFQVKTALVAETDCLGAGLDVADGNVGQGHSGNLQLQTGNRLIQAGRDFRASYPF